MTLAPTPTTAMTAMTSAMTSATTAMASTASASAGASASATVSTISTTVARWLFDAVEVRFFAFVEFCATFNRKCSTDGDGIRLDLSRRWWLTSRGRSRSSATHLGSLLFQDSFAGEANAIALDREHLHQHLIAFFQFVADVFDAMFGDFADVQQAFGAGNDFDECPEVRQTRDFAEVSFADFGGCGEVANDLQRLVGRSFVVRCYVDLPGVLDIDLHSRLLDDGADHLATGSNHVANLVDRNLQGVNARRVRRDLFPMGGDHLFHLSQNEQASAQGLGHGFAHDLGRDAGNLDIHLQGGDPVASSCDFEVHVAVVVFGACDVGQDGVLLGFLHQTHRHPGYGCAQRNPGIEQGKRRAADRGHRRGAVGLENVGDDPHGIGPLLFCGEYRRNSALGERAVADLAPPRAAQEGDFTDREGREIVMQHEALLGFPLEDFEPLHVVAGAERGRYQSLGFTPGEDCRAVGARQDPDFDPDGTNLIKGPAVGTPLLLEYLFPKNSFTERFEIRLKL